MIGALVPPVDAAPTSEEAAIELPEDLEVRVEAALLARIGERRTVTYLELARALAIPPPHHLRKLILCLESLATRDHAAGRPLRSALVVSRVRAPIPAPGFFAHLARIGAYSGPDEGEAPRRWHEGELRRVFGQP